MTLTTIDIPHYSRHIQLSASTWRLKVARAISLTAPVSEGWDRLYQFPWDDYALAMFLHMVIHLEKIQFSRVRAFACSRFRVFALSRVRAFSCSPLLTFSPFVNTRTREMDLNLVVRISSSWLLDLWNLVFLTSWLMKSCLLAFSSSKISSSWLLDLAFLPSRPCNLAFLTLESRHRDFSTLQSWLLVF